MKKKKLALLLAVAMSVTSIDSTAMMVNAADFTSENNEDIELYIDSLSTGKRRTETISLKGLPERSNYALRLRISTMFLNDKMCKITFEDVGFGEFFSPTGFSVEKVIELGGSNGQFNSLS